MFLKQEIYYINFKTRVYNFFSFLSFNILFTFKKGDNVGFPRSSSDSALGLQTSPPPNTTRSSTPPVSFLLNHSYFNYF